MVVVSRWKMSEMNMSDAPSRQQEQKQQQQQSARLISEQTQSEACLARASVNCAPDETYHGTRSMSQHSSKQATLSHSRGNSHWTGADGQDDDVGCGGTLAAEPCTSLCVGKEHAPDTGAGGNQRRHHGERNRNGTSPPEDFVRRNRTSSTAASHTHVIRRGSQRNESPAARSSWPSDSAEPRCLPPEIRKLGEPTRKQLVTDAEIDAAMSAWMEAEFMEWKSCEFAGSGCFVRGWTSSQRLASLVPANSRTPGEASRAGSTFHLVAHGCRGCERYGQGLGVIKRSMASPQWDYW